MQAESKSLKECMMPVNPYIKNKVPAIIYTLAYPDTKEVFYVGCTAYPKSRKSGHESKLGFTPIMEALEDVYVDGKFCTREEAYWINQFLQWGFILTNSQFTPKYEQKMKIRSKIKKIKWQKEL